MVCIGGNPRCATGEIMKELEGEESFYVHVRIEHHIYSIDYYTFAWLLFSVISDSCVESVRRI